MYYRSDGLTGGQRPGLVVSLTPLEQFSHGSKQSEGSHENKIRIPCILIRVPLKNK